MGRKVKSSTVEKAAVSSNGLVEAQAPDEAERAVTVSCTMPPSEREALDNLFGKCQVELVKRNGGRGTDVNRGIVIRTAIKLLGGIPDQEMIDKVEKMMNEAKTKQKGSGETKDPSSASRETKKARS